MLSYAFQILKQSNYDEVASEKFDNAQDLFAAILSKGIAQQLKQGLYREYITKNEKWHEEILKYIAQNIKQDDAEVANFSKYFVNDKDIAVYTPIKINTQKYVKEFIDEINLAVAKGTKKIIVNFEKINFFTTILALYANNATIFLTYKHDKFYNISPGK